MARSGYKGRIYVEDNVVPGVEDFTVARSRPEIPVRSREKGVVGYLNGLIDVPIDFEMHTKEDDPTYKALEAAFESEADDNYLSIDITNRPKTAEKWKGITGDWIVTKFETAEPIDGVAMTAVSIRVAAASDRVPTNISSDSTT